MKHIDNIFWAGFFTSCILLFFVHYFGASNIVLMLCYIPFFIGVLGIVISSIIYRNKSDNKSKSESDSAPKTFKDKLKNLK